MTTQSELKELNDYASQLTGDSWKQLAHAQYNLSRREEKSHRSAMEDVYNKIIALASSVIKGE